MHYLPHFKIILYIVVFVVCFGLALLIFTSGSNKGLQLPLGNKNTAQTSQTPTTGWMTLATSMHNAKYTVGEDIELTVHADSSNKPVTGYDMLFLYDPASISVVRVNSVDPTFDIFTFNNPNYVSITGTKKLSISSQAAFMNTPIVTITVRAKKAGTTPLVIAPQIGPEKTKMVDNAAQLLFPQLDQSLQLSVQ